MLRSSAGHIDTRAIRAFRRFSKKIFIHELLVNPPDEFWTFFEDTFIQAAFTPERETVQRFRVAAGGSLDQLNDNDARAAINFAASRARICGHIESMKEAEIEWARVLGGPKCGCGKQIGGLRIRVHVAANAVNRMIKQSAREFAAERFHTEEAKLFAIDPGMYVRRRSVDGAIPDRLVAAGFGIPPYSGECMCRLVSVIDV